MDRQIIDWLRDGPVWIKYAVDRYLLDSQPDVHPVLKDPVITEIVARLKNDIRGLPAVPSGYMSSDEYQTPYWDLFFLADVGLKAADLRLIKEIDEFLGTQSASGTFMTEAGMDPAYFCKSAILLASIVRLGYQDDVHVKKFIRMLLSLQRLDGGWYCNPDHNAGNIFQHEPSCPQDNLNILLLLGQYEQYRHDSRCHGAIDLLLRHWEMRNKRVQIVYFGVGRRYRSLQYPATRYGILRVLDALSLFPYSFQKATFHNMLDFVHSKAVDGKYSVEIPSYYTDLERQDQPNRWLTFLMTRIDKRVNDG
jgi:hypothetical protein